MNNRCFGWYAPLFCIVWIASLSLAESALADWPKGIHKQAPVGAATDSSAPANAPLPQEGGDGRTLASSNATCGSASSQLQSYVAQVNAFANNEYYRNIPMRCGPNPSCVQWWLGQLNAWYTQQSQMVNSWYQQIATTCTNQTSPQEIKHRRSNSGGPGQIDETSVDELKVDDQDKTVRITIPATPSGFR